MAWYHFGYSKNELIETFALKLTPWKKIELEATHILIKTAFDIDCFENAWEYLNTESLRGIN